MNQPAGAFESGERDTKKNDGGAAIRHRRGVDGIAGDDLYIMGVAAEHSAEEVSVGDRNGTVRVEKVPLDKVLGMVVPIVVDLKRRATGQIVAADEIIQDLVAGKADEPDLIIEVYTESYVQHDRMDTVTHNRQCVAVRGIETCDVEYAVRSMNYTSTCVDRQGLAAASPDGDAGPRFSTQSRV